jgi:hypothetical protein
MSSDPGAVRDLGSTVSGIVCSLLLYDFGVAASKIKDMHSDIVPLK